MGKRCILDLSDKGGAQEAGRQCVTNVYSILGSTFPTRAITFSVLPTQACVADDEDHGGDIVVRRGDECFQGIVEGFLSALMKDVRQIFEEDDLPP